MPLIIHFINVGHGDCTIIEHPDGALSIVDINNGNDLDIESRWEISARYGLQRGGLLSLPPDNRRLQTMGYEIPLTNPIEFLKSQYPERRPFRYIQTHPDLDHMRGLSSLITTGHVPVNFWDTQHTKLPDLQEVDKEDWETYIALQNGHFQNTVLHLGRDSKGKYYNMDEFGNHGGHEIEILSPFDELADWANRNENWNSLSYVLRVSHAGRSVILGGDAESIVWDYILDHYGSNIRCDILKASHHGRDSGYHQQAVEMMSPLVTVVSVGKKPDTDASNKYRGYSEHVWSTCKAPE